MKRVHDFVFIFVGRLVSDKGINELVEAFAEMRDSHIKLLLVGAPEADLDPLKKETLQLIATNEKIIAVGYQQDVRPYFAISNVLVFPSYREGFPNVVMQAGAMELPSIVTDINGCNEIIIEGENGTIIPVKNVSALKEKMELFISNRTYVDKLRANARAMIASRYEQKAVWEALLEEYKSFDVSINS
jgi:glycosyltransferase involved in cell wall biosynthesis